MASVVTILSVNGPLRSCVIKVIFVHLVDDNGIRNYPGNYPWLRVKPKRAAIDIY